MAPMDRKREMVSGGRDVEGERQRRERERGTESEREKEERERGKERERGERGEMEREVLYLKMVNCKHLAGLYARHTKVARRPNLELVRDSKLTSATSIRSPVSHTFLRSVALLAHSCSFLGAALKLPSSGRTDADNNIVNPAAVHT